MITNLAVIYAWTGEKDLALEKLTVSAQIANGVAYGELKLNPQWDPLRGDSRFDKIVASLAPKENIERGGYARSGIALRSAHDRV